MLQAILLDTLLYLVIDNLCLLDLSLLLVFGIAFSGSLHFFSIHTGHLPRETSARLSCLRVLFSVPLQPLLLSVLFGGFAKFRRLVLREEEWIITQHEAVKLGFMRVRSLSLPNFAALLYDQWSIYDIWSATTAALPAAQSIYRFHFYDNSWLVSLFELIELLTWCFCQSSHLLDILGFSLVETSSWVCGR